MAKNNEKYAYLNRLSTEQLEELLRMDAEEARPGNEDVVFHILEVIEQREDEHPTGRIPDVDKAWAEFQEYYNIPEGVDASLYPCETEPDASSENPAEFSHPRRPRLHRWLKQGLVAVIAVAAVFGGMVAAQAAGIDVFGTIGRWTDEVFHFVPSADENNQATGAYAGENAPEYSDLREALASLEIDESLAPTWFPNGFEAGNLEVVSSSVSDIVNFVASSENGTTFSLDIIRYTSADYLSGTQFEKDTENIEQYSNDQQTFYILSNVDTITATWSDGLIVEQITGNISDEYMKKIIDSIGGV